MAFQRGDDVEVASKEEGFLGSYYDATVVSKVANDYIIQYKNLIKDDRSGPLREMVAAEDLRPVPPEIPVSGFEYGDVVDAFHNDGWWVGKISGKIGGNYFVYFENTKDELPYKMKWLRVHQDWVDGQWIVSKNIVSNYEIVEC